MSYLEACLLAGSIVFYLATLIIGGVAAKSRPAAKVLGSGLLLHLASASVRWYDIGHPPIFGTYEAALAGSWFMLLYTASSYREDHGHFRPLVLTTVPLAIFILLYGLSFNTERIPLTISERSLWVEFHALFSWIAFGGYTAAACLSTVFLWKSEVKSQEPGTDDPSTAYDVLDDLIFRYINWGFVNHTVMFALGSYYSSILLGVWWQWDLVNSTSLITWLSFGLAIHMRLFYGWKGKRGAKLAIVCFMTAIVSYWGLIYFPPGSTYHVFDIELKAH